MIRIVNNQPENVLSFYRESKGDKVMSVINFSDQELDVNLNTKPFAGSYSDVFCGDKLTIDHQTTLNLEKWGFRVLTNR